MRIFNNYSYKTESTHDKHAQPPDSSNTLVDINNLHSCTPRKRWHQHIQTNETYDSEETGLVIDMTRLLPGTREQAAPSLC